MRGSESIGVGAGEGEEAGDADDGSGAGAGEDVDVEDAPGGAVSELVSLEAVDAEGVVVAAGFGRLGLFGRGGAVAGREVGFGPANRAAHARNLPRAGPGPPPTGSRSRPQRLRIAPRDAGSRRAQP